VLNKRLTGPAAVATLLTGLVIGTLRLGLELGKRHLAPGSVWAWLAGINFLHFAALLFVLSTVILVSVSLVTTAPSAEQVAGLTMQTTTEPSVREAPTPGLGVNLGASVVLASIVGVLWIVFR
jgi:SSS family solute:Na+ symporter